MENDILNQTWKDQHQRPNLVAPDEIIKQAKRQRYGQFLTISILSVTFLIVLLYALYYSGNQWNEFTIGLVLMVSSLVFRIALEYVSLFRKESQLITLDSSAFRKYLKKHYGVRLKINYMITPICFAIYVFGFTKLLPYFKLEFSEGFYMYILISGIISLIVLALIIIKGIVKETKMLRHLSH